jgi:murein DD-endopeptidase
MRRALTSLALIGLVLGWPIAAQQRTPLVNSIEITVPVPPSVVPIGGRSVVAYELHLTNFQNVSVALSRVQILSAGNGTAIADYTGDDLEKRMGRPGLMRPYDDAEVIGAGLRGVVYLWIELPETAATPASLQHRVELDVRRPAGPVRSVVTGRVAVSTAAPVVLGSPVRGGLWTAIYDPLLMSGHRTAIYTLEGRARIPSRFAVDLIRLPADGAAVAPGAPRAADWNGYGDEVLAVADGVIAQAMDDIAENADPPVAAATPMPPEIASGNYVALDLGGGRFAFYEHLKRGTVVVRAGDRVTRGQVIARLGNSGSSSIGPHLHFHVADANATLGAEGLPFVFREFHQMGAYASIADVIAAGPWQRTPAPVRRLLEHPAANAVLSFVD